MTVDAKVQIGLSSDFLEGTKVTTPAGSDLFREGVVISDPEIPGARAEVRQMGTELTTGDWGLVTHSVIQGFSTGGGGQYHDVKVTPSGALTVEADVVGTVAISGTVQIAEPVTVEGTVALDAATLAALENVNATVSGSVSVNNFPTTQAVSGTVALDSATLAALETINVGNFPATQVVSDGGGSLTVDGSVSVNNHPASQSVVGAGAAATAQRVQLADESLAALESISATVSGTVSVGNTVSVSATDLDIRNLSSAQDSVAITDGGGSITVDGSVSVTGTVAVSNFPATQAVSATDLDIRNLSSAQDSVTVTGSVNVGNFPATQAVSGTVTANLGTLNGAATAANQTTGNTSLSSIDNKLPDLSGTWGYNAGTSGTLTVAANKRVLAITATAPPLLAASMTINGGQSITIPAGTSITINPRANLTAPTLVFTSTSAYFVEFIE